MEVSARSLDQGVGAVLEALDENDLVDNTLVTMTTDHGLALPDAKATLFDRGTGVLLLMRGPGGFERGRVFDSLVSQLDLFPTICDVAEIEQPDRLEGLSLIPLVRGELDQLHDQLFSELTYHAAYEPQRAVRTARYKYVRRFDEEHPGRAVPNLDDSLTKDVLLGCGWAAVDPPVESLYDVRLDPSEGVNRIDDPALADVLSDLKQGLHDWMVRTDDPLLQGAVPPAEGTFYNTFDQISPSDPTTPPTAHSRTLTHRVRNRAVEVD